MEEFKGTKGEWRVKNEDNGNCFIHLKTPSAAIARIYTENEHSNEAEANAKLIAAAPDLLESLQDCIFLLEAEERKDFNEYKKGLKAIEKALK